MDVMIRRPYYGWIIVTAGFLALFVESILYLYGVFITPLLMDFGWSHTIVSSIYATAMAIYTLAVIPMGWLNDRYGPRTLLGIGALLTGLGLLLSSAASTLWHLYCTFGVVVGIGLSPIYVSIMPTLIKWFTKRRGLAVGIASSGIGFGQFIMAPVLTYIINSYHWRLAFTITGLISAALLLIAALMVEENPEKLKLSSQAGGGDNLASFSLKTPITLSGAVKTCAFWMIYFCFTFACFALFMVLVHIMPYAVDSGIPSLQASIALGLIGIIGTIGKVVAGIIADKIGISFTLIFCCMGDAMVIPILLLAGNVQAIFLFTALFGLFYGGWMIMYAPVLAEFFGTTHLGSILGVVATTFGMGGAIGPVIAGYIIDLTGNYLSAFLLGALMFVAAAIFYASAYKLKGKRFPRFYSQGER